MTRSSAERRASLLHRAHARTRRAGGARGPATAVPLRTPADELPLTRLLPIARLTPAQAVALGADLLAALETRNPAPPLHPEAVRVGRDGRARLLDAPGRPRTGGTDLEPTAAVLDQLGAATARPVLALERAAAAARSPDGRLAVVAAILREADATGGAQARAELGRAVAVIAGDRAGATPAPPARTSAPRRRRPPRTLRTVARAAVARSWKWVLSVVVLVAVVGIEIAFLRDDISRDITAVLEAGRAEVTATEAPTALPPVVPPAPATAGTIDAVDLRPVQPCAPGTECALRVQVRVQPQAQPQTIVWSLRVLDRCTGEVLAAPGGTATVPAHGDRLDAVVTVALPEASALAVTAVTDLPSTAASTAVPVPENGACTA
jgi:hypothetical protein